MWFLSLAWPVLSTVFIYFLSLLSCFIFLIALFFIFHSFPGASTSSLFNWFSSYFSLDHFYCFFELSFWKLYSNESPWRQILRLNLCSLEQIICGQVYICHLPVFIFLFLQYPCWGSLLPGLFLGVAQIGIGAPFFDRQLCGRGTGGMVNWAQNLVMVSALLPNRPWWVASFRFGLQRVSVAHNERLTAMTPGLSLLLTYVPLCMPTRISNQRLFLNNKHGASSWFLFIYLLFLSAAVCNVEIDFHNVCLHRCS